MGFFGKLTNWFRGKGWKETEEIQREEEEKRREEERKREISEGLEAAKEVEQTKARREKTKIRETERTEEERKEERRKATEFEHAVKEYNKKGQLKTYEDKLDKTTINKIEFEPTPELGQYRNTYKQLLMSKAKLDDPEILDILIENRNKLRHRFSATITIYTNTGEIAAEIAIEGLLIEELSLLDTYFTEGQKTEYLSEDISAFTSDFETRYGLIGTQSKVHKEKCVIGQKRVQIDFA